MAAKSNLTVPERRADSAEAASSPREGGKAVLSLVRREFYCYHPQILLDGKVVDVV